MAINQNTEDQSPGRPKESHLVSLATGSGNYWFSFVSDPVTVVFFVFWEAIVLRSSILIVVASFGAGLLSWSLLEYTFHRWVYHKGRTPAHVGHKKHHESPEALIAMPWFIVTAVMFSLWFVFAYFLRLHFTMGVLAGLLAGFVFYGIFHHIHHHFHFKNRQYRKLRAHHFIHHQYPDTNFGVTSRLWDHVFGTTYRRELKQTAPATGTGLIVEDYKLR
jgi:sterol desaturase/sphingolipid hydroxylase (fatty acid hydroxylase superfamily)